MFSKIRCVHIAVKNIDNAVRDYSEYFGLQVSKSGELAELGVRNALLPVGDAFIEFLEPINKEEGPLAQFLQNRGEGVYMMAWEVESVDGAVEELQKKGVRLINADPESRAKGANVIIHPKASHGVMIELLEKEQ